MKLQIVEKAIVHYTNKERRKHKLGAVRGNNDLIRAARRHAEWCAGRNRMTHTGQGKSQPWDRARQAGYSSAGVSENMWQQHGQNNTTYKSKFRWRSDWQFGKAAVITWLNSPGHRANLLNPRWTDIGVGLARRQGHTMLVQMFGDRPKPLPKVNVLSVKKSSKPKGGPYSHFHNWSFHTHHNRPKGGNHYRAVRRRQRPWRVGFMVMLVLTLAAVTVWLGSRCETQRETVSAYVKANVGDLTERRETWQQTRAVDRAVRQQMKDANVEAEQDQHEREIVERINVERSQRGIGTLTWDTRLQAIARAHSRDMATQNYFSHTNKAGLDYRTRAMAAGYRCPNPRWQGVAENLYFGSRGHQRPEDAVLNWLDSPGHRRAMLDVTFSRAAIGIHEGYLSGYGNGYYTTLLLC